MAIRIDVVVVVIDRGDESGAFIPFVGMPIAPCFKLAWPGPHKEEDFGVRVPGPDGLFSACHASL